MRQYPATTERRVFDLLSWERPLGTSCLLSTLLELATFQVKHQSTFGLEINSDTIKIASNILEIIQQIVWPSFNVKHGSLHSLIVFYHFIMVKYGNNPPKIWVCGIVCQYVFLVYDIQNKYGIAFFVKDPPVWTPHLGKIHLKASPKLLIQLCLLWVSK